MIEVEVVQTSQAKNKFERLGIVEMFAVGLGTMYLLASINK